MNAVGTHGGIALSNRHTGIPELNETPRLAR